MKNTVKRILCAVFALIIVLGAVPAFATDAGDTIRWYDDEGTDCKIYTVTDKITADSTVSVNPSTEWTEYCYILDVENPGYYLLEKEGDFSFGTPATFENGVAHGDNYNYLWYNDSSIYYFEKGENLFSIGVQNNNSAVVSFEYLGEKITGVEYDDECLQNLLIGCEVVEDHNYFQLEHFSDVDITFSSGKTIREVYTDNVFYYEAPLKEGKNTGYLELINHYEPVTFTAYPVSKYIESMEISNAEKLLEVKLDYLGYYRHPNVCKETVTIKFTDGTKLEVQQLADINRGLDFPNGHHYNLITSYTETDDGLVFELGFSKHMFNEGTPILYSAPCKVSEASLTENLKTLSRELRSDLNYISNMRSFIWACRYMLIDIRTFFDYYI